MKNYVDNNVDDLIALSAFFPHWIDWLVLCHTDDVAENKKKNEDFHNQIIRQKAAAKTTTKV